MSDPIIVSLLFFAAIGFAGAGIAFAVARAREIDEAESDVGMRAVALLLSFFGGTCAIVATGVSGLFGFGAVIAWFSYILAADKLGVFRIEQQASFSEPATERRRIA